MRKFTALGSIGLVVTLAVVGCKSSDEEEGLPDAGGVDAPSVDVNVEPQPDVAIDAAGDADAGTDAPAEAETDAPAEAALDAPVEAADDGDAAAEACAPATYDCSLFTIPQLDGGADVPGVSIDGQGNITFTLAPGAPAVASATVTLSYTNAMGYCSGQTADLALTVVNGTTLTLAPASLPLDFVDVCGISVLHLKDSCSGDQTDIPVDIEANAVTTAIPSQTLGAIPAGVYTATCLEACGPSQWKAVGTGACNECPPPDVLCSDLNYGYFGFDPTTNDFAMTLSPGAPEIASATLKLAYVDTNDMCANTIDVPLTVANGQITGTAVSLPADFMSFNGCANGGTFELVEKCGSTVSFTPYAWTEAVGDGGTGVQFGLTSCD